MYESADAHSCRSPKRNARWIAAFAAALAALGLILVLLVPVPEGPPRGITHTEGAIRTRLRMLREAVRIYQQEHGRTPDSLAPLSPAHVPVEVIQVPSGWFTQYVRDTDTRWHATQTDLRTGLSLAINEKGEIAKLQTWMSAEQRRTKNP
jgi:hypothetical protein